MSQLVEPGDVLAGKYRVERVLGAGGMGVVVAARHLQLDVLVAVKFMTDEAQGDVDLVARFLREGRAAARLRSEHIARVTDVGTLESGAPYQVMEYLDGRDLSQVLVRSGPLPVAAAAELIVQACDALQEAHSAGIVHRDIKPSNLFLTSRPDGTPCVKLLDFGISKTDLRGAASTHLHGTHAQTVLGTPFYMAPEQMRASLDADSRADIWALGATLYELLTGRVPFRANTLIDLAFKVAQSNPRPLRLVRSDIPPALEEAVLRCLEKDRDMRFSTARDLALALTPFASRSVPGDVVALRGDDAGLADANRGPASVAGSLHPVTAGPSEAPPPDASPRPWWKTGARVSWGASGHSSRKRSAIWLAVAGCLLVVGAGATFGVLRSPSGVRVQAGAAPADVIADRRAVAVVPVAPAPSVAPAAPSPSVSASSGIPTVSFAELPEAPQLPAVGAQGLRPMGAPAAPWVPPAVAAAPPPAPGAPAIAASPTPAAPQAASPAPAAAGCDQPTYLDEHGRTKFKPECLDSPLFKVSHALPGTQPAASASPPAAPPADPAPTSPPAASPVPASPPPKAPAPAYDPFSSQR